MSDFPLPPSTDQLPPATPSNQERKQRLRRWGGLGGALVALAVLGFWWTTRNQESTDDAFIEANVVQISPHVGGYVAKVWVNDNQWVKSGEPLVEIDARDYTLHVKQAEATLDAAKARHGAARQDLSVTTTVTQSGLAQALSALEAARSNAAQADAQAQAAESQAAFAHGDSARFQALYKKDEISRQRLDQVLTADTTASAQASAARKAAQAAAAMVHQAEARLEEARSGPRQVALKQAQADSGQATVAEAQAALDQARLELSYTQLTAPVEGRVAHKDVFQGQLLQPGPAVMALVYGVPWVVANFKETQLKRMRPGQPVQLKVDAFPGRTFKAHVDSIQPGTGSRFSLLPAENATGNYVKVVQRIPVKIVFDEDPQTLQLLVPGMSVEPEVDLKSEHP